MLLQRSVGRRVLARAHAVVPLSSAQKTAAVHDAKRFSATAVRVIQEIVRATADGSFGPLTATAVGAFQANIEHAQDGIIDETTLDQMVISNRSGHQNDATITLIESFYDLDVASDTLSVRYDKDLASRSALVVEFGNLRVITLGPSAFTGARVVRDAIKTQLDRPGARLVATTPVPKILTSSKAASAVAFNKTHLRDARSVTAVQAHVGQLPPTGEWDRESVQRIAQLQAAEEPPLEADGKIGQLTLRAIANQLETAGRHNSVLRLIVDFYKLDQTGLLDVFYDPTFTAENAVTRSRDVPGPSTVLVGPKGFEQTFEGLVHTVAHEFEHVRQRRTGMGSQPLREFLGESTEIFSKGTMEEDFTSFMQDAGRVLQHWHGITGRPETAMTDAERAKYWDTFVKIRDKVRERYLKANAEQMEAWAEAMAAYELVGLD